MRGWRRLACVWAAVFLCLGSALAQSEAVEQADSAANAVAGAAAAESAAEAADTAVHPVFRAVDRALDGYPLISEQLADSLDVPHDRLGRLHPRKLIRRMRKFLGGQLEYWNSIDTAFITPQLYNYQLMLQNTNTFERFTMSTRTEPSQRLEFAPNRTVRLGGYFGWRWLILGYTFDIDPLFHGHSAKKQKTEIDMSFYTQKVGIDLYFRKTGNDFRIKNLDDLFSDENPRPSDLSDHFSGLNIQMRGLNVYYIFNHRYFSYPAAFSQSTVQRRSAGTWKLGFSFTHHKVTLDESAFDERIAALIDESMFFQKVRYNDYCINFGYAYNWVFARNWLLAASVSPGVAYNVTNYTGRATSDDASLTEQVGEEVASEAKRFIKFHRDRLNLDTIVRLGLVYNNNHQFFGASLILRSFRYKNSAVSLENSFGSLNIYVGINFLRKKAR